jgi:polyferredoxin
VDSYQRKSPARWPGLPISDDAQRYAVLALSGLAKRWRPVDMLFRLGQVLNWAFTGLAVLFLIPPAIIAYSPGQDALFFGVAFVVSALASYLIGRACRYVLSGD